MTEVGAETRFIGEKHTSSPVSSPPTHTVEINLCPGLFTHHPSYTVIAGAAWETPASQVSHGQHKKGTADGYSQHGYVSTLDNFIEYEPLKTEKETVKPYSKSDTLHQKII